MPATTPKEPTVIPLEKIAISAHEPSVLADLSPMFAVLRVAMSSICYDVQSPRVHDVYTVEVFPYFVTANCVLVSCRWS